MKLKPEYVTHMTGTEAILVPTGAADFSGIVRGNKTLGIVLELLQADTTEAEIIATLHSYFDAPVGSIEKDVTRVLGELRKVGVLDE